MEPSSDNNNNSVWNFLLYILTIIIQPLVFFICGWVAGLLISWILGDIFVDGMAILNITLKSSDIPLLCGIFGIIGSFFKDGFHFEVEDDDE